jgi:pyruvate carboxylase subunit B
MSKKKVEVMITAFRDGFQSVFGARVLSADYLPVVEACAHAGIRHFEAGGGASFQSSFFYCNENAFDVMDGFRRAAGEDANLQTLGRGINVVALDSQPRDIIRMHARLFKKHGIDTIRNFDALNDVNNLISAGRSIVEAGLDHEIVVTMMELPPGCQGAHTVEFYEGVLRRILDSGVPFHSVCFKDASGTASPRKVHDTIVAARKMLPEGTRIVFHTHDTAGIGIICYGAAIRAGVDQIDLSLAPVSHGTCQPDVVTMWHALRDSTHELAIPDIHAIIEIEELFKEAMRDYFTPPEARSVEPLIPLSPMPGGALTANTQMMRDNGILHRYPEVIKAMGDVVRRGGFGTSVTPVSQFYFQQAFNNVFLGPWEKIAEGYGKMVLGYFGRTPVTPDPEIVEIASQQLGLPPTSRKPEDMDEEDPDKGVDAARDRLREAGLPASEENVFIAATCKEKGIRYLKGEASVSVRKVAGSEDAERPAPAPSRESSTPHPSPRVEAPVAVMRFLDVEDAAPVRSDQPGRVVRLLVRAGDRVGAGDPLLVQELMLTEHEIHAPHGGTVVDIPVRVGDYVAPEDVLLLLSATGADPMPRLRTG